MEIIWVWLMLKSIGGKEISDRGKKIRKTHAPNAHRVEALILTLPDLSSRMTARMPVPKPVKIGIRLPKVEEKMLCSRFAKGANCCSKTKRTSSRTSTISAVRMAV